jgi:hypothetical protein
LKILRGRAHFEDLGTRWEDNIKMDLREIEMEAVDWLHLAQDTDWWPALVNTVTNPRVL